MNPLITIETVPIKIEYVEKEQSSHSSIQSAQLNISRNDNLVTIQSNPINIPLTDTFELSSSSDWSNLTYTATVRYSDSGNLRMNVQMQNSGEYNTYQYQQFGRGIDNMVDVFPKTSDSSYRLENMQIDFDISQFFGNATSNVDTSFTPPNLELKVVERPKVIVKYVGGPIYVPKSADPDFDASKAIGPLYFPESADPNYDTTEAKGLIYFPESANPNYDAEMAQIFDGKSKLDLKA